MKQLLRKALPLFPFAFTLTLMVGIAHGAPAEEVKQQEIPVVSVPKTVPASTTSTTSTTTTTTTTLPDVSGVDFVALARGAYGKCGEWHDLAISVGWPEEEWNFLREVIWRESRCQPDSWNGADAGLMQINQVHTEWLGMMGMSHPEDMFDPEKNLLFGFRLWETSGWRPWRFSGPIPE